VDGDLRKPAVHRCLGFDLKKGFTDFLVKPDDSLDEYLRQLNDLYVFPGSASRLIPVSALSARNLGAAFARFRREFQLIVVDSPPLVPVVDSHVFAGLSDGVVLVVRARRTSRELFQTALENLRGANLLGVLLNDVDLSRSRYSYAYKYYERNYVTKTQQRM
jgi:Mrp family chromosome partitioning ATPase